ncbi:Tad domain-containing protein [Octadecabacter sp. G9-8]|uniref:Tad domain-containing protein n=1 Tax=Octadecabacter dasysiphoniae TaxID=2909341 RepID=A0ABS9CYL3_9RHOB|nr:TadE/TadG family type IV pilus assembly protein [Octadecabacter dasysiphoniae]MCF2871914.1 Tad domain-containing protein [Octadecabacter dasysiphoniae]
MKRLLTKTLADTKTTCAHIRRFRRDEEGGMIIFSLFMLVLILALAGMAVDLMRFETTRAKLQGTLDRATLAAADLDQTISPAAVVLDYFEKTDMTRFLQGTPIVDEGINYRIVTANASAEIPTFFFDLPNFLLPDRGPGATALTVSGTSTAEERVSDVEISLVLDVSSSMLSNSRITNLRPAARDFVTTVLANNTDAPQGLITISMIPYSAVVNPGSDITPFLNINRTHSYSTCPLFDDTEFSATDLNLSATYDHVSHFSYGGSSSTPFSDDYAWCYTGDRNSIIVASTDEVALHTAINDLEPYGNTAIDMGMKWAVGLLDPSTQEIITSLAGKSGTGVPALAAGRPYPNTQPDVLKVVVLMTDGQNTQQWDLVEPFKSGLSTVWFNREYEMQPLHEVPSNRTSIQYSGESTPDYRWDDWFYWTGYGSSSRAQRFPNGFSSQSDYVYADSITATYTADASDTDDEAEDKEIENGRLGVRFENDVYNATWQDLYADRTYNKINNTYLNKPYNHYYIPWSDNSWAETDFSSPDSAIDFSVVAGSEADTRLSSICQAARDYGIIIYTVAFEAPSGGRTALQDCASSPSHYFDVDGTDISDAFSAIATDIRALKLTQ